jgi:Arc/MetJ-type ribon-helix-helix transcriptional regulator
MKPNTGEEMSFDIPSDYAAIIEQAVASGAYPSQESALRHALELFAAEQIRGEGAKLNQWHLRNNESVSQSQEGLSKPLDESAVVGRLNARLAEQDARI